MRWSLNLSRVTLSSTAMSSGCPLFESLSVATAELPSAARSILATTPRSFSSARATDPVARVKRTASDRADASFFIGFSWVREGGRLRRRGGGQGERGQGDHAQRREAGEDQI